MYNSGDAAEQIVRMSLEGAEVALKITGISGKEYCRRPVYGFERPEENQGQGAH